MKKLLVIVILGLLLSGNAYADMRQIEQDRMIFPNSNYTAARVITACIDGYKFVIVRANKSISTTQAFEEKDGRSVPSKC